MYVEDFRRAMARAGFADVRYTSVCGIEIGDAHIREMVGEAGFESRTVRAFKVDGLEDICEDYGQTAIYKGTIPGCPDHFDLDMSHRFGTNDPKRVCGNTASMLADTRYA